MEPFLADETIREIFTSALELPQDSRVAFLDNQCGPSGPLRQRVIALLEAHSQSEDFFSDLVRATAAVERIPEFLPGELVGGRFTIVRLLGQGGSGDIYEARDSELVETVALKVLRACATDEDYSAQFREEVRLARKVLNPHVCRVHDVGRHSFNGGTILFLTMELLAGRTLANLLRDEPELELEVRCRLVRQIAEGLQAAHRADVVHGDLKSSNVSVLAQTPTGLNAVITDFGLARYVGASNPLLVGGTPGYMAPEQLEGAESGIGTDIYSFGILAFETLAGKLPFPGRNRDEIARARLLHTAPEVRTIRPEIDQTWNRVVARCLERDPARRYESITQAIAELPGRRRFRIDPAGLDNWRRPCRGGGLDRSPFLWQFENPRFEHCRRSAVQWPTRRGETRRRIHERATGQHAIKGSRNAGNRAHHGGLL